MALNPGALRFNTDSQKLELFDGNQWVEIVASSPEAQTGGARGVYAGGFLNAPVVSSTNIIEYVTISTTGNGIDFGDLTIGRYSGAAVSSTTRGVYGGGRSDPSAVRYNVMDYITISSTGNALDFGDLTNTKVGNTSVCNSTRGVFGGGYNPALLNVIEYITINSLGNAVDFGDLLLISRSPSGQSNSTRGIFSGSTSPANINVIEFITISTLGNSGDFGDLLTSGAISSKGISSNAIRGIYSGSITPGFPTTTTNIIQYVTFATLGNAVDFGDQSVQRNNLASMSSSTRAVFAGGQSTPAFSGNSNVIDYVQIMTLGNAVDFGDITENSGAGIESPIGFSNGHGGL